MKQQENIFDDEEKTANDNHSNQLNPNNDAYWTSRGFDDKPSNWEDLI